MKRWMWYLWDLIIYPFSNFNGVSPNVIEVRALIGDAYILISARERSHSACEKKQSWPIWFTVICITWSGWVDRWKLEASLQNENVSISIFLVTLTNAVLFELCRSIQLTHRMLCHAISVIGLARFLNQPRIHYKAEFSDCLSRVFWGRILRVHHHGTRLWNCLGVTWMWRVFQCSGRQRHDSGYDDTIHDQ